MSTIVEAPRPYMPYAVRAGLGNPGSFGGFHDDEQVERTLRDSARCKRVTAYGMPWMEWCGARTIAGTPFCPEHY